MMEDQVRIETTDRGWKVTLQVDGEDVSGLSIIDQKVRSGRAALKMAGIAGVWTGDRHRKLGYATRVMWASIEEMGRRATT